MKSAKKPPLWFAACNLRQASCAFFVCFCPSVCRLLAGFKKNVMEGLQSKFVGRWTKAQRRNDWVFVMIWSLFCGTRASVPYHASSQDDKLAKFHTTHTTFAIQLSSDGSSTHLACKRFPCSASVEEICNMHPTECTRAVNDMNMINYKVSA